MVLYVYLKMILRILLGYKFNMFLYLLIAFLQIIDVCFVVMLRVFVFAVLSISPRIFIHSCFKVGSVGGVRILLYF
jgi:hypothetical protein